MQTATISISLFVDPKDTGGPSKELSTEAAYSDAGAIESLSANDERDRRGAETT